MVMTYLWSELLNIGSTVHDSRKFERGVVQIDRSGCPVRSRSVL